jgi:hypothetical protein
MSTAPLSERRGLVVAHVPHQDDPPSEHEHATLLGFAERLAQLLGMQSDGVYDPRRVYGRPLYFVPCSTLTAEDAAGLDVQDVHDLFGGVVPHRFVGSKAISHPVLRGSAAAPEGWNHDFARSVGDAVLAGYSAFAEVDARDAGRELLLRGPVRIKPVRSRGGHGQVVVDDVGALDSELARLDGAELRQHGVVLEEHVDEDKTFSVGQVIVGDLTATYFGWQRLTRNNNGREVFGGSDLTVVRGGFDELLALQPAAEIRLAVELARRYDEAVHACYSGFFASRRNYDVLLGRSGSGEPRCGVLEQSWRVGGATGPELAALEVFHRDPRRRCVRASCYEVFGGHAAPPEGATVYFSGHDPHVGPLTKYTVILDERDDDARQHD